MTLYCSYYLDLVVQENNIQGYVILQYVVNKDGNFIVYVVVLIVDARLLKEAIPIIKPMIR